MKATLSRADFAAALAAVSPAIPSRPTMPILAAVHLEVANDQMAIRATDYYLAIERTIDVDSTDDGVVLVSGLRLRDLVKQLSGDTVSLTSENGGGLLVAAKSSKYNLATYPESEYPETQVVPPKVGETTAWALDNATRTIAHALQPDASKTSVHGVILDVEDGHLWAATTDAFRLAAVPLPWSGGELQCRVIHAHMVAAAKNLTGDVAIHVDRNHIAFVGKDATVTSSLIDGDPVRWRAISNIAVKQTHILDRDELIAALSRTALVLEREKPIRVTCDKAGIDLSSEDDKGSGVEHLEADGDGDIEFGVNPTYLVALLNAIPENRVSIASAEPRKPLLIHGFTDDQTTAEATHVVMPIRLPA